MVKKCTPCIRRTKYTIKAVRLPPYQLRPPQARDADPRIRALAYQPGRALLPKLRLDGAGFHPALGPGKRGFLRSQLPLSRSLQYISPPLARAIVQRTFKTVLLISSLPRKGMDKEAGRSARTPAPKVALLLPAQAQSGAPLRARGATRRHPHSACLPRPRLRLYTPARPPSHPQTPSPHAHAERAPHATGKGEFKARKRGRLAAKGQGRRSRA